VLREDNDIMPMIKFMPTKFHLQKMSHYFQATGMPPSELRKVIYDVYSCVGVIVVFALD